MFVSCFLYYPAGSGVILCGEVSDSGSPALIQFDVVKFIANTMDVWTPPVTDLFSSTVKVDEHGDESDASYESDDDAPMEEKMAMGRTDKDVDTMSEQGEAPSCSSTSANKKGPSAFTKVEALDKARKYCHIFHLFSGLLPPKLAMNVYQKSGADRFLEIKATSANITRFQHYTPLLR